MIDWNQTFANAHRTSWPVACHSIQNTSPNPAQGSENIFKRDKERIIKAAQKFGYLMISKPTAKYITFVNHSIAK